MFFVDKVNFQDPVAWIAMNVGIAKFNVVVRVEVVMFFVAEDVLVRKIPDQMTAMNIPEFPSVPFTKGGDVPIILCAGQ